MDLSILATIAFFAVVLQFSHGHYAHYWVSLTPAFFLIPLSSLKKSEKVNLETILSGVLILFQCLCIFKPSPIYSVKNSTFSFAVTLSYINLLATVILFFHTLGKKINYSIIEKIISGIIVLKFVELLLVVFYSPEPKIDVWYYLQIAADSLSNGQNPYVVEYPQIYKSYKINLPYPPMSILIGWISKVFFGDIRVINVILLLSSSVLLILNKKKIETSLMFLGAIFIFFPTNPFLIEQAWIDVISVFFLLLTYFFYKKEKILLSFFIFGLFLSIKQYHIFYFPMIVFFFKGRGLKDIVKILIVTTFGLVITYIPFIIWDYSAFFNRILNIAPPHPIPNFQTLHNWFGIRKGVISNLPSQIFMGLGAITTLFIFWKSKKINSDDIALPVLIISSFIIGYLNFYSNSAFNYWWFATGGLWVYMASSFGDRNRQKLEPLQYEFTLFLITRCFIIFGLLPTLSNTRMFYEVNNMVSGGAELYTSVKYSGSLLSYGILWLVNKINWPEGMIPFLKFRVIFQLVCFLADLSLFFVMKKVFKESQKRLFQYILMTSLLGQVLYESFAIFFALFMTLFLITMKVSKRISSCIFNILAIHIRPEAFITYIYLLIKKRNKLSGKYLYSTITWSFLFILTAAIYSYFGKFQYFANYWGEGFGFESLWGGLFLLLNKIFRFQIESRNIMGTQMIFLSGAEVFKYILILVVSFYSFIIFKISDLKRGNIFELCFIGLLGWNILSPSFSTDLLVIFIPLGFFVLDKRQTNLFYAILIFSFLELYWINELLSQSMGAILLVNVRNALICYLIYDKLFSKVVKTKSEHKKVINAEKNKQAKTKQKYKKKKK